MPGGALYFTTRLKYPPPQYQLDLPYALFLVTTNPRAPHYRKQHALRKPVTSNSFASLKLSERTLSAVKAAGYDTPTEIQALTIPELLAGNDVLGTAQTGTGKTAAFVLPMVELLTGASPRRGPWPRGLVVTPTRELAAQVQESIETYARGQKLSSVAVFGGASKNKQAQNLAKKPDVLVATPGRLLDFVAEGTIDLSSVSYLVLDEADRMLDMGFIPAVRQIVNRIPKKRQTALFSATMPRPIEGLAQELLHRPVRIEGQRGNLRVESIQQLVIHVDQGDKIALLPQLILDHRMEKVLVFTRTKHRARKVAKILTRHDFVADSIHGEKSQGARVRALNAFKSGDTRVLVATDVASRGLDVDDVSHVVNFELPNEPETYVHRIGRTARAGADGVAISLCDAAERAYLKNIEKLIGAKLTVAR